MAREQLEKDLHSTKAQLKETSPFGGSEESRNHKQRTLSRSESGLEQDVS